MYLMLELVDFHIHYFIICPICRANTVRNDFGAVPIREVEEVGEKRGSKIVCLVYCVMVKMEKLNRKLLCKLSLVEFSADFLIKFEQIDIGNVCCALLFYL